MDHFVQRRYTWDGTINFNFLQPSRTALGYYGTTSVRCVTYFGATPFFFDCMNSLKDSSSNFMSHLLRLPRTILTIATGKPVYFDMAINLARSFMFWHSASDISFHLVSDRKANLPPDLARVQLIRVEPGALGEGFAPKLHLDRLAPARQTLFIDADCLCVGNLSHVFDRFAGRDVSVVGGTIDQGEWFGDVAQVCAHFNVTCLPKFNGGVGYLEPGAKAEAVLRPALCVLARDYDRLGPAAAARPAQRRAVDGDCDGAGGLHAAAGRRQHPGRSASLPQAAGNRCLAWKVPSSQIRRSRIRFIAAGIRWERFCH